MLVRGIRGATTAESNTKEEIIKKTKELLITLKKENDFKIEDIVSVLFRLPGTSISCISKRGTLFQPNSRAD